MIQYCLQFWAIFKLSKRITLSGKTFEFALNTAYSNAGAEGLLYYQLDTQTSARTLNAQLSVMRNGKPVEEVPSRFFDELVAWSSGHLSYLVDLWPVTMN